MELRTDDGRGTQRAGRLVVWAIIAAVLLGGVVAALVHAPRLTPLLETLP